MRIITGIKGSIGNVQQKLSVLPQQHIIKEKGKKQQSIINKQVFKHLRAVQDEISIEQDVNKRVQQTQVDAKVPQFNWIDQWYMIAFDSLMDKTKIHQVTLLERPLAVWWDHQNERWSVMLDICPHKLVPLSEGKITPQAKIQCPYHGWEFSSCGKCERITFVDEDVKIGKRQSGTAYPCYVSYDMLWVKLEPYDANTPALDKVQYQGKVQEMTDNNPQDMSKILEGDLKEWKQSGSFFRDVSYDYVTFFDNILDSTHINFTHYQSMVKSIDLRPQKQIITANNSPKMLEGQTIRSAKGNSVQANFVYPCMNYIKLVSDSSFKFSFISNAIPVSPGKTRMFYGQFYKFTENSIPNRLIGTLFKLLPNWWAHVTSQNLVLDDDLYFLHKGEKTFAQRNRIDENPGLKLGQIYSMPHSLDRIVTEFRTWLSKYGGGGPFGPQDKNWLERTGPPKSFDEVYERYNSHTKNCRICQDARRNILRSMQLLKGMSITVGIASIVSFGLSLTQGVLQVEVSKSIKLNASKNILSKVGVSVLNTFSYIALGQNSMNTFNKCIGLSALSLVLYLGFLKLKDFNKLFDKGLVPYPRNLKQEKISH